MNAHRMLTASALLGAALLVAGPASADIPTHPASAWKAAVKQAAAADTGFGETLMRIEKIKASSYPKEYRGLVSQAGGQSAFVVRAHAKVYTMNLLATKTGGEYLVVSTGKDPTTSKPGYKVFPVAATGTKEKANFNRKSNIAHYDVKNGKTGNLYFYSTGDAYGAETAALIKTDGMQSASQGQVVAVNPKAGTDHRLIAVQGDPIFYAQGTNPIMPGKWQARAEVQLLKGGPFVPGGVNPQPIRKTLVVNFAQQKMGPGL